MSNASFFSSVPADRLGRVEIARKLADLAAEVTLSLFRRHGETIDKAGPGAFDPVTRADREAEQVMRAFLESELPDDGIDGEEFGIKPGTSAPVSSPTQSLVLVLVRVRGETRSTGGVMC